MRIVGWLRAYPLISATLAVGLVVVVLDLARSGPVAQILATAWVSLVIVTTLYRMIRAAMKGHVGLDILAVMAMIATLAVGEYLASLIIVLMLAGGEALEDVAARRARRDLTALMDRSPRIAHLLDRDGMPDAGDVHDVTVDEVEIGDLLLVRPSEIIPVDGMLQDAGTFDESSLTGESLPVSRDAGDEILSGAVNGTVAIRMRVTRRSADSQYQQIVALVRTAQESRAPVVRLADRFAIPFTAVSLLLAGIAWAISGDPTRFAEVLVLATPCPLLIAAPVAFLGGLSRAAKAGVVIKSGAVIEQLAKVQAVAFDKTGTLTRGRPELIEVRPQGDFTAEEVLRLAASAEQYSSHALAAGIRDAASARGLDLLPAEHASEVATNAVTATIHGRVVVVGKPGYVDTIAPGTQRTTLAPGQAAAYIAIDGHPAGAIVLADEPREESEAVVTWLRRHGVARIAMLTGDARETAESIGAHVGITEIEAELLPADKVRLVREMQPRPVMMVGDGVNDAPVLAAADMGVAMGARGATAAGDAADIVILVDSLSRVVDAVTIGRSTLRIALTAIWIGIALSIGLMVVAMTGVIPAVGGALLQEVVDLATILYALRALRGTSGERALRSVADTAEPRTP